MVGETRRALRGVVSSPALRRLLVAWALSMTGSIAFLVALSVVAYREGGGAAGVGGLMVARMAVSAVFAPFTSVLADRWSPRRTMVATDLVRAALVLALAAAVGLDAGIGAVYVLACLIAVVTTAFRPAQAALTPVLARTPEELTCANAIATTIESAAIFAGPGIGGVLLAVAGTTTTIAVCAALLLWSAVLVRLVPDRPALPAGAGQVSEPLGRTLSGGFRALAGSPLLAAVVGVYALQAVVAGALAVFTVVLALEVLHIGNAGVGYLDSAVGVGGIVGGAVAAGLAGGRRLALAFAAGVLAWGVGIALVGVTTSTVAVLLLLAGVGVGNTVVDVAAVTLLQRSAPAEVVGRVFGVLEAIMLTALGLGALIAPAMLSAFGTRPTIVITGLSLPVAVALTSRWLLQLDRVPPATAAHVRLLRELAVFAPLPGPALEQLAVHLRPVTVLEGAEVVRQGEPGDDFYIVESGTLQVTVGREPRPPIGAGGFFGEIALLRQTPRTATVTAASDCRLLALDRERFLAAVTGHAESAAVADLVVSRRLAALRPSVSPV